MKQQETNDQLPTFDWDAQLEAEATFDDSHFIEQGIPYTPPIYAVSTRARQMFELMLSLLPLQLTEDETDALFDPDAAELDFADVTNDQGLFEKVQEHLSMTVDYWETIFEQRPPLSMEEKKNLTGCLWEMDLVDGRIVEEDEDWEGLEK